MNYWPGTKIVKSQGNAFDWRNKDSCILSDPHVRAVNTVLLQKAELKAKKSFTIYSKARRKK